MRIYVLLFLAIFSCKSGGSASETKDLNSHGDVHQPPATKPEFENPTMTRDKYECENVTHNPKYGISIGWESGSIDATPAAEGMEPVSLAFNLQLIEKDSQQTWLKEHGNPLLKKPTHFCSDADFSIAVYDELVIVKEMPNKTAASSNTIMFERSSL